MLHTLMSTKKGSTKKIHLVALSALAELSSNQWLSFHLLAKEKRLQLTGEDISPGVKKGAFVSTTRRSVKCVCFGNFIPSHFEVDVSRMDIGERYYLDIFEDLPQKVAVNEKVDLFKNSPDSIIHVA